MRKFRNKVSKGFDPDKHLQKVREKFYITFYCILHCILYCILYCIHIGRWEWRTRLLCTNGRQRPSAGTIEVRCVKC